MFPGSVGGSSPGNDLLDGLLTVFTALFPIRAKTSGSEILTAPPSPGKLLVGVAGDLQELSSNPALHNLVTLTAVCVQA